MRPALFIRPLTSEAQQALTAGLRSPTACTMRRCQILLASSRGQRPSEIARKLGCASQTVRTAIQAFHTHGAACLTAGSRRPKTTQPVFDQHKAEALRVMLRHSPRAFGKPSSVWTLALAAEVCHEQGLTERHVRSELIRQALKRLGVRWQRAKHWITSPDPAYERKKSVATA